MNDYEVFNPSPFSPLPLHHTPQLCDDVPTELQALSSSFTSQWQLTTSNAIGTPCCETLPDTHTCSPTFSPTNFFPTALPTTFAPTALPTTPAPSAPPSVTPTVACDPGTYLDTEEGTCVACSIGRYAYIPLVTDKLTCALTLTVTLTLMLSLTPTLVLTLTLTLTLEPSRLHSPHPNLTRKVYGCNNSAVALKLLAL